MFRGKYDINKMLEEIKEDENLDQQSKSKKTLSQDDIEKMLSKKRKAKKDKK